MKLIVGLGNPGKEYENTRHNVGFSFVDYYLKFKNYNFTWKKEFNGEFFSTLINNQKVIFLKPLTYMNLSGECVSKYMNYYHISMDDILVISDDMDLFIGNYKLKLNGSSGGHNGLKNIEMCLSSSNYKRLKIGISKNNQMNMKDYVLGKLSKDDLDTLNTLYSDLVFVIDDYFILPFSDLMSKYNRKNR